MKFLSLLYLFIYCSISFADSSVLANYLKEPSPEASYKVMKSQKLAFGSFHYLKVQTLVWDESRVTPNLWKHWLGVVVPPKVKHQSALFIIDGGKYKDEVPEIKTSYMDAVSYIASQLGAPIVYFRGTPMQPLKFNDSETKKVEDQIIAYTFDQFLKTGDSSWPLLLPMVKSTITAMTAAQSFLANYKIKTFILSGASKRGWTTWLTGALDNRVIGIAPVVFDMLNFKKQLKLQKLSYGKYSESLKDYLEYDLPNKMLTHPLGEELLNIVDPINYIENLKMPKLLILASGDSYWTVDSANIYWNDLKGNKNLFYLPNAGHSLDDKEFDVLSTLAEFSSSVMKNQPLPRLNWLIDKEGRFHVDYHPENRPYKAVLWHARADTRDFRVISIGKKWNQTPLPLGMNSINGRVDVSPYHYDAYFIEFEFPSQVFPFMTYKLTTQIFVNEKLQSLLGGSIRNVVSE